MHAIQDWKVWFLLGGSVLLGTILTAQEIPPTPPGAVPPATPSPTVDAKAAANTDVQIQLRGPLHEAYAEQYSAEPTPGPIVKQAPPATINEQASPYRPQGNADWIPGYWAWDGNRNDYLWVSGLWRVAPPGQRWVPGYWYQDPEGYRYVNGFWYGANSQQAQYLPQPPAPQETGPTTQAPGDNYFWSPGYWNWTNGQYTWSPGMWAPYQSNYVWMPSRNVWTPRGNVFVAGHWDTRLASRGQAFAPAYISAAARNQLGFTYTPSFALNAAQLPLHMYVNRNGGSNYYFGNYYGDDLVQAGYVPWYSTDAATNGVDPLFAHARWYNTQAGRDYVRDLSGWHDYFAKHDTLRPGLTVSDQTRLQATLRDQPYLAQALLGSSLDATGAGTPNANLGLVRLNAQQQASMQAAMTQSTSLRDARTRFESAVNLRAPAGVNTDGSPRPVFDIPRITPLAGFGRTPDPNVPAPLGTTPSRTRFGSGAPTAVPGGTLPGSFPGSSGNPVDPIRTPANSRNPAQPNVNPLTPNVPSTIPGVNPAVPNPNPGQPTTPVPPSGAPAVPQPALPGTPNLPGPGVPNLPGPGTPAPGAPNVPAPNVPAPPMPTVPNIPAPGAPAPTTPTVPGVPAPGAPAPSAPAPGGGGAGAGR